MNPIERYWWRIGLELKLRQHNGDAFQDFFGRIMQARHGDDYIRVRPYGQLGDKGCDGYLASSGKVYQCYGAVNGDAGKVDYLIDKMGSDFLKARAGLKTVMNQWHMAHNLVDGLPIHAIEKLKEIQSANPTIPCAFVGFESIADTLLGLDEGVIAQFLGPAATLAETQNLQASELRDLVASVLAALDASPPELTEIKQVPAAKLAYNALPTHWTHFLASGWQNAHHVGAYFSRHPDPLAGERVARRFRERYAYLRAQNLGAPTILASLCEMIVGQGNVPVGRMVAAQALLAHLVESCDVLETPTQATLGS